MSRIETIAEGVTLYLGDYRDVLPMLPPVDAVVTSPPYASQRNYITFVGDKYESLLGAMADIPCKPDAQMLVNLGLVHKDGFVVEYWEPFKRDMAKAGWRFFGWYVWDQMSGQTGNWNGRLAPSFEFVFHFNKSSRQVNKTKPTLGRKTHGPGLKNADGIAAPKTHSGRDVQPFKIPDAVIRTPRDVAIIPGEEYVREHPARFPVAFAKELVAPWTAPGDLVIDPFLGSGTTGEAAIKMGRRFIGVEIEPKYFDIACRRLAAAAKQPDMFFDAPKAKQEAFEL